MMAFFPLSAGFFISAAVCLITAFLAMSREGGHGRHFLAAGLLASSLWSLMEGFLLVPASEEAKLYFLRLQYIGVIATPLAVFFYVLSYLDYSLSENRLFRWLMGSLGAALLVLVWTNGIHQWFWPAIEGNTSRGIILLQVSHGPLFFLFLGFVYLLVCVALFLLFQRIRLSIGFDGQLWILLAAVVLPVTMNLIHLTTNLIASPVDLTPLGFAGSTILIAVGFFRYRLQDLQPLAQQKILSIIPDGILVLDRQSRILMVNQGFGFSPKENLEDYVGLPVEELCRRFPGLEDILDEAEKRDWLEWEDKGRGITLDVRVTELLDRKKAYRGRLFILRDITSRKAMERNLKHLATTDSLTGVFNRRYFAELAEKEIKRAERYGHPISLLYIDADHFKRINDTWGHDRGDQVLIQLVEVFRRNLRETDYLARMGGEEFVILLPHQDLERAAALGERFLEMIRRLRIPLEPDTDAEEEGREVPAQIACTVSMGAVQRRRGETYDQMLIRGDLVLYRAKAEGRDRLVADREDAGAGAPGARPGDFPGR